MIEENFPLISVVVPVYFGEDTIVRCIQSIIKQDYPNIQLIVIDDGSKDKSVSVLYHTIKNLSGNLVMITHEKNQGIAATLNEAIERATGEYLFIVHQDCELCGNDYLSRAFNVIRFREDVGVVTGQPFFPVNEFGLVEKTYMTVNDHVNLPVVTDLEEISFSEHKCDLFRKAAVLKSGGFDATQFPTSAEDQMLSWRLRQLGYKIIKGYGLIYVQRYGRSVSRLSGLSKKLYKYGKTQAGVFGATGGGIIRDSYITKEQQRRLKNRFVAVVFSLAIISFCIVAAAIPSFLSIPSAIGIVVFRMAIFSRRSRLNGLRVTLTDSVILPFLSLLADFSYFSGFCFGSLSYLVRRQIRRRIVQVLSNCIHFVVNSL